MNLSVVEPFWESIFTTQTECPPKRKPRRSSRPWRTTQTVRYSIFLVEFLIISEQFIVEKLLVILRDGRKLVGILRSYDQFANFVLQETVERIYYRNQFSDIPRGVFLVRGENVVFCGEIDSQVELQDRIRLGIQPVPVEEILVRQRDDTLERDKLAKAREHLLKTYGYINEMETEQF